MLPILYRCTGEIDKFSYAGAPLYKLPLPSLRRLISGLSRHTYKVVPLLDFFKDIVLKLSISFHFL